MKILDELVEKKAAFVATNGLYLGCDGYLTVIRFICDGVLDITWTCADYSKTIIYNVYTNELMLTGNNINYELEHNFPKKACDIDELIKTSHKIIDNKNIILFGENDDIAIYITTESVYLFTKFSKYQFIHLPLSLEGINFNNLSFNFDKQIITNNSI